MDPLSFQQIPTPKEPGLASLNDNHTTSQSNTYKEVFRLLAVPNHTGTRWSVLGSTTMGRMRTSH
jgi:hypothetical protein